MTNHDSPAAHEGEQYAEALLGEGAYWDSFIAQQLLRGEMPGSADRRLSYTHYR
jgi:hypothetical protein